MGRTDLRRRVSVAAVEKIRCVKGTLASPGDPIRLAVCQFYRIFGTRRADRSQQRAAVKLRNLRLIVLSITALGIVFYGSLCDLLSLYHRNFLQQTTHES